MILHFKFKTHNFICLENIIFPISKKNSFFSAINYDIKFGISKNDLLVEYYPSSKFLGTIPAKYKFPFLHAGQLACLVFLIVSSI